MNDNESMMTKIASGGNVWNPYKGGKRWNYHFSAPKYPKALRIVGYIVTVLSAFLLMFTFSTIPDEIISKTATVLVLEPVTTPWFISLLMFIGAVLGLLIGGVMIARAVNLNMAPLVPARLMFLRSLYSVIFVTPLIILVSLLTNSDTPATEAWLQEDVKVISQGVIPMDETQQNVYVNKEGDIVGITVERDGATITYKATVNPDLKPEPATEPTTAPTAN